MESSRIPGLPCMRCWNLECPWIEPVLRVQAWDGEQYRSIFLPGLLFWHVQWSPGRGLSSLQSRQMERPGDEPVCRVPARECELDRFRCM
mmetsp:Transcript_140776/g.357468  ORF Transcript_140776/g.357468 Transcript_140776/m.357468 type:complete len:90 (+) Transcript_140776:3090-3359(+)